MLAIVDHVAVPAIQKLIGKREGGTRLRPIDIVPARTPLRATVASAFSEFFLSIARDVYPHYGSAQIFEDFGVAIRLG